MGRVIILLIGEYEHSIDQKGRINFPTKLLEDLGEKFIITKGLDNCLFVYSYEEWKLIENKIKALPMSKTRNLQRFLFSSAAEISSDKQGRIVIPKNLRDYADLSKNVIITGVSVRCEIWDRDRYNKMNEEITPEEIESAMEDLGF